MIIKVLLLFINFIRGIYSSIADSSQGADALIVVASSVNGNWRGKKNIYFNDEINPLNTYKWQITSLRTYLS